MPNDTAMTPPSLLAERIEAHLASHLHAGDHWEGYLASSALATATAGFALDFAGTPDDLPLVQSAAQWLLDHQNPDGGWGDTPDSPSNLSTTLLALSFLERRLDPTRLTDARQCLLRFLGDDSPTARARGILDWYGRDRTFAVPILTQVALAGGRKTPSAWSLFPALPFEAGLIPRRFYQAIRLPVVSYALPALLALGLCHAHQAPPRNPLLRLIRRLARPRALHLLTQLQPESGGYLEAIPLTAFVVMALTGAGNGAHPVAQRGLTFLRAGRRPDGSWPIDTHLATWLTSLAIAAGAQGRSSHAPLLATRREALTRWLLDRQWKRTHPFTLSPPGGWAWTPHAGGVPDADDTAAALIALCRLNPGSTEVQNAAVHGMRWLFHIQNADGGIPTFCAGWQNLPFDRSAPDLTAHALRALAAVWPFLPPADRRRGVRFTDRALTFLAGTQRRDGCWIPLWFGHQRHPRGQNPVHGTSRVLLALAAVPAHLQPRIADLRARGRAWLLAAVQSDGGWGGAPEGPSGCEETALALEALAVDAHPDAHAVVERGYRRLARFFENPDRVQPQPIGFYFASLWYSEALYPWIFAWAAARAAPDAGSSPAV